MLQLLKDTYSIDDSMMEAIRHVYIVTKDQVIGETTTCSIIMVMLQGCLMSPLLFALFFNRVANYVQVHTLVFIKLKLEKLKDWRVVKKNIFQNNFSTTFFVLLHKMCPSFNDVPVDKL